LAFVPSAIAQGIRLDTNVVVSFASVEAGIKVLTNRDDFIAALSPFERAARMLTDQEVTEKAFLEFVGRNVRSWTPEETNRLTGVLQAVAKKLFSWHLPFPRTVLLIKTSGQEEINAFYTRQNAIIFPEKLIRSANSQLIMHELFHVLSRQNPELRTRLYGIIGFSRINEVEAPEELRQRKWTNPDGVQNGWSIVVTNQNQEVRVVPDLYAPANFDYTKTVNPFGYFNLLAVKNDGGHWVPKLAEGYPQLFQAREVEGFYEQIGRNTRYLIHPDEILADNFVLMINGETNLPTPRIVAGMKKVFIEH
jgi:hypothetical protein